jgi:hypothetical protein
VAEGLSNREVAQELGLSEHTVKEYLFRIFEKLGISTRVELVLYAVNQGNYRQAEWLPGGQLIETCHSQPCHGLSTIGAPRKIRLCRKTRTDPIAGGP